MKGVNAGVDMDMASGCYLENIATLLAEGKLQQKKQLMMPLEIF
jgi:hypothetical protein